jgi:pimeloyl-ACP methyl ester carboxylesterase
VLVRRARQKEWQPLTEAAYAGGNVPTLILCGTHSPGPSRTIVRLLAEAWPGARQGTVRDAGHMSPITHPAEVNRFILERLVTNGAQIDTRGQEENPAARSDGRSHALA